MSAESGGEYQETYDRVLEFLRAGVFGAQREGSGVDTLFGSAERIKAYPELAAAQDGAKALVESTAGHPAIDDKARLLAIATVHHALSALAAEQDYLSTVGDIEQVPQIGELPDTNVFPSAAEDITIIGRMPDPEQ